MNTSICRAIACVMVVCGLGSNSHTWAVNISIDYTYAGSDFFNPATQDGQNARAAVEAAAGFLSGILGDSYARIETPEDYISTAPGGSPVSYSWTWSKSFTNPSTGSTITIVEPIIPEDQHIVYVGARNIPGSTLGLGGVGGSSVSAGGSYYFQSQLDDINAITDEFFGAIDNRGQGDGDFGAWGGAVTFDTSSTWNFDHTTAPSSGENDLYSVALHELMHTLGFGSQSPTSTTVWESLLSGSNFTGAASSAEWGSAIPLDPSLAHWPEDSTSVVYNDFVQQETLMDPDITTGTRKALTTLDAAALTDLGWQVAAETKLPGDYNFDGSVDAADYTIWRDNLGGPTPTGNYAVWVANFGATAPSATSSVPEPHTVCLAILALGAFVRRRC